LVLAVAAISPAAAVGAANGTDRPLKGTVSNTTTVSLVTGAATSVESGHLSHLGAFTGNGDLTFSLVGPNGFSFTGTGTLVAANGDELFTATVGSGTFGPPIETTSFNTITGGTGRFAGASGTYTATSSPVVVSITATSETTHATSTWKGKISY
jgi:hypothetical protein